MVPVVTLDLSNEAVRPRCPGKAGPVQTALGGRPGPRLGLVIHYAVARDSHSAVSSNMLPPSRVENPS